MPRSLKLYLDDILNSINKIQKYTANFTYIVYESLLNLNLCNFIRYFCPFKSPTFYN